MGLRTVYLEVISRRVLCLGGKESRADDEHSKPCIIWADDPEQLGLVDASVARRVRDFELVNGWRT